MIILDKNNTDGYPIMRNWRDIISYWIIKADVDLLGFKIWFFFDQFVTFPSSVIIDLLAGRQFRFILTICAGFFEMSTASFCLPSDV